MTSTRIGLLGCGTVGSAVVRALHSEARLRSAFTITAIAVRDPSLPRDCVLPVQPVADVLQVALHPDVDVLVEAMGGLDGAMDATLAALHRPIPVVTANKALLAVHGPRLRDVARDHGVALRYEASVAAAIPLIRTIEHLARSEQVERVEAVLNGTCNFVLELMGTGRSLEEAVAQAQQLGFAEADPTRDLDGTDTADKLAVLAQLLWQQRVTTTDVQRTGITRLSPHDVQRGRGNGRVWRVVASATSEGCLVVEPRTLPTSHPLANLDGPANGVILHTRRAGTLTFLGAGAGGDATASAIVSDLLASVDEARAPSPQPAMA